MAARGKKASAASGGRSSRKSGASLRGRGLSGPSLFDFLNRRTAWLLWGGGLLILAALVAFPVSSSITRTGSVLLLALLYFGLAGLLWRLVFVRWALIAVTAGGSVFWFLPGKTLYDRIALREEAARALRRYEGVRYHWGGENRYGIDCSGLVRRGAIEAAAREGLRTGNSLLVRKAASLWWHDLSARDMRFGGNGEVRRLMQVKALRGADHLLLYPGDFAITEDGVHAIAYLGDYLWIEADPEAGKVVVEDARTTSNSWFQRPVSIMRWRFLQAHRAKRTYKTTD